jgi:formylglycine-generating enzyme required for sulfatase activity
MVSPEFSIARKTCRRGGDRNVFNENVMRIQEAFIVLIFGAMILAAMLVGQKPDERYFPLREWAGKDEFVPDSSGPIWIEPETGMEFVWVKGGCFEMGCIAEAWQCNPNEYPVHKVCLDGFWIGKYPVTQKQWLRLLEENPSFFRQNADHPVENLSWHDARKYIDRLNMSKGKDVFRLPTEAQWEYTCRDNGSMINYSGSMDPEAVAWHRGNSGNSTRPVGLRMPNKLGLFDMSGNVFEWVRDVYGEGAYGRHNLHNPIVETGMGPAHDRYLSIIEPYIGGDKFRVIRGGSWRHPSTAARCSNRYFMAAGSRQNYLGFRIAADLPAPTNIER